MHVMARQKKASVLKELQTLYATRYVSLTDLEDFKQKYAEFLPSARTLKYEKLRAFFHLNLHHLSQTNKLYDLLENRDKLNREFIKREQQKPYQIEGNPLDPEQIAAVVACEDAELILAPAGSGKTASLLAKLSYLMDELKIPPKDILVIAFTNKVVSELRHRLNRPGVEIRTFHSLGNKIIKKKMNTHHVLSDRGTAAFFLKQVVGLTPKQLKRLREFRSIGDEEPDNYGRLIETVIGLQKAERIGLKELERLLKRIKSADERKNALQFFRIYKPIAEAYQEFLDSHQFYDFADMLNIATDLVEKMPADSFDYQYILVDEAQDLSAAKYRLLKAILDKCHRVKLFAVGDDWQSIYRFAGSNLKVLDEFEQIFSRETYRGLIQLTYRFGQPVASMSNKFIQKNPYQSHKKVKPHVSYRTTLEVRLSPPDQLDSDPPDYFAVNKIVQELYQTYGDALFDKKIQIISRYNNDCHRLVYKHAQKFENAKLRNTNVAGVILDWRLDGTSRHLRIPYCSIHKAKGITRDIVIILNATTGSRGFPADRGRDPVSETLLTELEPYPFAEERRLFYVAITRAKEKTFIVSERENISSFVFEIDPHLTGSGATVCPKCHQGILIKRESVLDKRTYYSCSNTGCLYSE